MRRISNFLKINGANYQPILNYSMSGVTQENDEVNYVVEQPAKVLKKWPTPKYAGMHTVTLLTGSLVGQQGSAYIQTIFDKVHAPISFEELCTQQCCDLPVTSHDDILSSVWRNSVALNIDVTLEIKKKHESLKMNNALDLYACVVNVLSIPGFKTAHENLDIVIISQNNVGDFSKLEYEPVPGVVKTLKICEDIHTRRIANFAFKYATKYKRKKLSFAHKSDMIPLSDGRFVEIGRNMCDEFYPELEFEDLPVQRLIRKLIEKPQDFDIIVSNEKYGTFLTSVAAAICGGPTLFAACELGDQYAVFKPLETKLSIDHEVEKPLNPYGTIMAGIQLLYYLGYDDCANLIWEATWNTMGSNHKTADHGGTCNEEDIICEIVSQLGNKSCQFPKFKPNK